jgi:hypothetical protein
LGKLCNLDAETAKKINTFFYIDSFVSGVTVSENHFPDPRSVNDARTGQTRRKGNVQGSVLERLLVFCCIQNGVGLSVQGQ